MLLWRVTLLRRRAQANAPAVSYRVPDGECRDIVKEVPGRNLQCTLPRLASCYLRFANV